MLGIPGSRNASGAGATPTAPAAPTPGGPPTQPALLTIRPQPPATSPTAPTRRLTTDKHPQQQTHLVVNTDHLHIAQPNQQLTHTRRINFHTDPPDSRCEQHRNRRIPPVQARTLTPPTPTSNAKSRKSRTLPRPEARRTHWTRVTSQPRADAFLAMSSASSVRGRVTCHMRGVVSVIDAPAWRYSPGLSILSILPRS